MRIKKKRKEKKGCDVLFTEEEQKEKK